MFTRTVLAASSKDYILYKAIENPHRSRETYEMQKLNLDLFFRNKVNHRDCSYRISIDTLPKNALYES